MMIPTRAKIAGTRFTSKARIVLTLALGLTACVPAFAPLSAEPLAGQERGTAQRVVHGTVEDKGGTIIKGAVVYLKDGHSSSIKSAISGDDGGYRFVQLSSGTDYELWAQSDGKKSPTRSISSFDSKNDITITLKIDK